MNKFQSEGILQTPFRTQKTEVAKFDHYVSFTKFQFDEMYGDPQNDSDRHDAETEIEMSVSEEVTALFGRNADLTLTFKWVCSSALVIIRYSGTVIVHEETTLVYHPK